MRRRRIVGHSLAMTGQQTEQPQPLAREGEHIAPEFERSQYNCPECGVLAQQFWGQLLTRTGGFQRVWTVECGNCRKDQIWTEFGGIPRMVRPLVGGGPRPHIDMPPEVMADYNEARSIVALSPRGACALNRLAVQKLVDAFVPGSANLNGKIGTLVDQGLSSTVQQALDALRVIGNNAVHPGELDLQDDMGTALALFECMNLIVEDRIARPSRISKLYDRLPDKAKAAIEKRDGKPASASGT